MEMPENRYCLIFRAENIQEATDVNNVVINALRVKQMHKRARLIEEDSEDTKIPDENIRKYLKTIDEIDNKQETLRLKEEMEIKNIKDNYAEEYNSLDIHETFLQHLLSLNRNLKQAINIKKYTKVNQTKEEQSKRIERLTNEIKEYEEKLNDL